MDRPSGQRDMVFCHECQNEWYRTEFGLTCPNCRSDFCEIIEADQDPSPLNYHTHPNFDQAPDPDEDDIDHVRFMPHSNGNGFTMHGISPNGRQNPIRHPDFIPPGTSSGDPRAALFSNFTSMLGGMMGAAGSRPQQQQQQQQQQPLVHTHMRTMTFGINNGRVYYSSNTSGTAGDGLQPRDPNSPQAGQPVENLHSILGQVFGGMEGSHSPGNAGPSGNPFASIFNMFFNPAAAAHGDAVYTQEALDRVISQLMEQNSTGSAPGPADPNDIASLPKKKVEKSMLGDQGNTDCSICMDSVDVGQEVTELYCGHWFHGDCIAMWLNSHDTCPHCRMGIREAKEKKREGPTATGGERSGGSQQEANSPSRSRGIRRASTMSARSRRRSSTASTGPGHGHRQSSGSSGSAGSASGGGLLDRARNLFSRTGSNS